MKLQTVFQAIRACPALLEKKNPDSLGFLTLKAGSSGQGVANSVPVHEACFADILNEHGFLFLDKASSPIRGFPCYHHQPGGTQTKVDFMVYETVGNKIVPFKIDLKHANGKTFYLNDGWFENDTLYVISWTQKKEHQVLIARGDEIPTEEERLAMDELIALKKKLNSENKTIGSLVRYIRFANQYKCDSFTSEFQLVKFQLVMEYLASHEQVSELVEQEPHSQSVSQPTHMNPEMDILK